MSLDTGNDLSPGLGVEKSDLERKCSEFKGEIANILCNVDWKQLGHHLNLSREKLEAIDQENESDDQRKIALLDAWEEKEGQGASLSELANALYHQQRPDLVEMLCDIVKKSKPATNEVDAQGIDSNEKIKTLQSHFDSLQSQLLSTLEAEVISDHDLLQALSLVRISVKNDFDSSMGELLSSMSNGNDGKVLSYFGHLRPLLTLTNCGFLQYLILKFGDAKLNQVMDAYKYEVEMFMKETPVIKMVSTYSGDEPRIKNYMELKIEFNESPNLYTLERLNNFKRQFCNNVCQSEFAFGLKLIEPQSSFVSTLWLIPSLIVSKLKESAQTSVNQTFYLRENVILMSLEGLNGSELLYSKVVAKEMSVSNAERIISTLSESLFTMMNYSDNLFPLNLLQRMCVLLDIITSQMPAPAQLGVPITRSVIVQCRNIADLGCICHLQIKIISGFPLTIDKNVQQYWYFKGLESAYTCFRSLKLRKVIQVETKYFYNLLSCTIECLAKIQQKEILMPMLLQLFRIVYACLSGLPIESLNAGSIASAVTPYFCDKCKDVQVAAINAGQFLIPAFWDSKSVRQQLVLSEDNIHSLLCAFGKLMPISSSLKLFHSFSLLPENCSLFMSKGIALLSTSVMVLSSRQIEKELAFHLLKNIIQGCAGSPAKDVLVLNSVPSDDEQNVKEVTQTLVSESDPEKQGNFEDLLLQFADCLEKFKNIVTRMDISTSEPFTKLKGLLNDLEQTISNNEVLLVHKVNHQLNDLLLGAVTNLLQVVIETTEVQHQRWGNFIMFSCWEIVKGQVKKGGVLIQKPQALHVTDTVLRAIATYVGKDKLGEISLRTIDFCLGVIQDLLFDEICDLLEDSELSRIKSSLIANKALHSLTGFRFEVQLILTYFWTDEEEDLKRELVLDQTVVTDHLIPVLRSFKDSEQLKVMLKKIRSLARIADNRQLFRRLGLLHSLSILLEQYSSSAAESTIAELIYYLLSDAPDPETIKEPDMNPIAILEEFMTVLHEGRSEEDKTAPAVDVEEILKATSGNESSSELVVLHAKCIHGIMEFTKDAFPMALNQPNNVIKVAMLVTMVQHMKKLCILYEENMSATNLDVCEKQVIYTHKEFFPEFFYLSFKVLQDMYSESLSDIDRGVYVTIMLEYLQFLHFIIEQWSRMNGVQELLVEFGAFYLLLNELHTASTTHVLTEEILYSVLTTLYNVTLNSEYSLRFRIVIAKQLLKQFFTSGQALKFIAKFSFSCLHRILSRSELRQLVLDKVEVDMLARCLARVDNFFGGYENLLLTLSKLAHFPDNWTLFTSGGVVQILMSVALTGSENKKVLSLRTLLNMIPEPLIPESNGQKGSQKEALLLKSIHTNQTTKMMTESPTFMELVKSHQSQATGSCRDLCHGIKVLTTPLENPDKQSIVVLDKLGRYPDCWRFCMVYLSKVPEDEMDRNEVLFYMAKSMYQEYNRELPDLIERSNTSPGFEYKTMMQQFCQKRILEVVRILTNLEHHCKAVTVRESCAQGSIILQEKYYDEITMMLDKALLDYLIFNMTNEVQTCILCYSVAGKLVHSHYIPKSIIEEFESAMGIDKGRRIYIFSPSGHPSSWQFKSAGQLTFSMLCKACDGKILSQDENNFKTKFFDHVYVADNPDTVKSMHTISYDAYLFRFAAGLLFRNVAPLYSQVCAEIGTFKELHQMMQICRSIILKPNEAQNKRIKIFLLALPSSTPESLITPGWDKFVTASLSPYLAYKLLLPGKPMIPKRLLCCMVKIGVLLFVTPFDHDLEIQLLRCCSHSLISSQTGISDSKILYIPKEQMRADVIPDKLWWSLVGWAKKEINTSLSTVLSVKPRTTDKLTHANRLASSLLASTPDSSATNDPKHAKASDLTKAKTVIANMLPPGFALNFNEHNTLPDKVIELPAGHTVLLHQPFQTSTKAECFAVLGKLKEDTNVKGKTKGQQPAYSWLPKPYLLLYFRQDYKSVLKVGFYINESEYNVADTLPGCPPKMIESPHLQEIITQVPSIIHFLLRSKGFLSLKSLLFWYESVKNVNSSYVRNPSSLDTRCWQKNCNYCDMRCDCCLKPCLDRYELKSFVRFGTIQSCSKECSDILFEDVDGCNLQRIHEESEMFVPNGHVEFCRGRFSTMSKMFPGLSARIVFSICQSKGQNYDGNYVLPPSTKYIKFWQKSLEKPFCIEYAIDNEFNALEMLHFQGSKSVFSPGEERMLMHEFHDMLIKIGVPYQLTQIELSTLL